MYHVYILSSLSTGKYYTGSAVDVVKRLKQHNAGRTKSTKAGRPWAIVYSEALPSKTEAIKRENQIKRYKGGRAFKKLVESGHSGIV